MRNNLSGKYSILPTLFVVLLFFPGLVSCASFSSQSASPTTSNAVIDWVNFIKFGGITYVAVSSKPGRLLTTHDLGPVFTTVLFKLEGNVQDPGYHSKNGDAAFLNSGTKIYAVKGYNPTFRLAAQESAGITLYEADTNPHARKGKDLLDIGGKVRYIGIVSNQDGVTELGAIKDPKQVATLINLVLQAPVNQNSLGGNQRYFIAFHLADGTVVTRSYWLDTGELARGILLPDAFGLAIKAAVPVNQ